MKYFRIGIVLLVSLVALTGCTGRYQMQVEQSLLMQENQRLEDALYVTHAQLVDLKRENDTLRTQVSEGTIRSAPDTPVRSRRAVEDPRDHYDDAPPYEPSTIDIPLDIPGSNTLPDALKGARAFPKLMPPRSKPAMPQDNIASESQGPTFPELPRSTDGSDMTSFPVWTPTR